MVEDCGPELTVGAVVLVRAAAVVHNRTNTSSWFLNVTPSNVGMLWPVGTRSPAHLQHPVPPAASTAFVTSLAAVAGSQTAKSVLPSPS